MSENTNFQILRDLSDVIATTKTNVNNFARPAEFGISTAFATALKTAFPDYSFEFYESSHPWQAVYLRLWSVVCLGSMLNGFL